MLSEDEKQDLRSLAKSSTIREEFRRLRSGARPKIGSEVDVDRLLSFLTTMSGLSTVKPTLKSFVPYTIVRL